MGNDATILDATAARHLVRRTGFGASAAEIARYTGKSRGAAADALLAYKPKGFKPHGRSHSELHNAWLKALLKTKTPLMTVDMAGRWDNVDLYPARPGMYL